MNELIKGDANIALVQAAKEQAAQKAQLATQEKQVRNARKIDEAAQDFEANFLSEMMKPMFSEVNKPDPLFGGGHGEQVFNGMMVQQYGKLMAARGGIGIADAVKAEMIKIQEAKEKQ